MTGLKRQLNWDLLRSIAMFLVVIVHSSAYLPNISLNFDLQFAMSQAAIICDPIFFILSGYFALRPLKCSLKEFYLKKVSSILFPILLYSIFLYIYNSWESLAIGGYFLFASELFFGGWWFIPALVPFLILSPFLYKAFEGIDDRWIIRLTQLLAVFYIWGVLYHLIGFAATSVGHPGLNNLLKMITAGFPVTLISGYFLVFCYGYLYRRLSVIVSEKVKRTFRFMVLPSILLSFVFAGIGVGQNDPNQIWVIGAFSMFFLFEKVRIPEGIPSRIIEWVAKRSYSVYLFQYTTIAIVADAVYSHFLLGNAFSSSLLWAIPTWIVFVIASYLLALAIASVLDPLILEPIQRKFKLLIKKVCR